MSSRNTSGSLEIEKRTRQEAVRKTAITLLLLGSLLPTFLVNVDLNVQEAGWSSPPPKFSQSFNFLRSLLFCQHWTLFSYMSPFNFTMHFEAQLKDGQVVPLRDLKKERAGKWQPLLFHNERKAENNLYKDRPALRRYTEYLIRTNGLDPAQVVRRRIMIRYRKVLPRDQAARAGTFFGPEIPHVLETY